MSRVWIILFTVLSAILLITEGGAISEFSFRVFITSMAIILFSLILVFSREKSAYSLNKIFYLFSIFFFGIAPYLQYSTQTSINGARMLKESEFFYLNIIILIILFFYEIVYYTIYQVKESRVFLKVSEKFLINQRLSQKQVIRLIIISLVSFFVVFYFNNFNIISMLIRGGVEKTTIESSQASSLIISRVFRPLSMMALLYYIFSNNRNIIILSFLLVITILTASPFGMARFQAAALYIPFIITTIPKLRRKNIFSLFFIFGLLIVFPFLNNFRYVSEDTQIKLGLDLSTFTQGHYDSYYNFALILTENIISWGRQLLGVFFFWIPRNFWPNKPVGSGHFIADIVHLINPNASCNYFAEGYINFGFLGIFIFTLLLAYITARLDKVYWNTVQFQKNNFSRVIYYVLLGMLFITLRGDLSVGFANTLSFLISIILVKKFVQLNEKNTSD